MLKYNPMNGFLDHFTYVSIFILFVYYHFLWCMYCQTHQVCPGKHPFFIPIFDNMPFLTSDSNIFENLTPWINFLG